MGHNTFESIGKPLPNRRNIVISTSVEAIESLTVVGSLEEAIQLTAQEEESFIIGGATIYKAALPLASRIYLTLVHADYEADTFFPALDMREWRVVSREDFARGKDFPHPFSFLVYERI
jgi:dihydrofolate reductase